MGNNPDRGRTISTVLGRRLGGELLRMREERDLRQTNAAEALTALKKAAELQPGDARFAEVYRIAQAELKP